MRSRVRAWIAVPVAAVVAAGLGCGGRDGGAPAKAPAPQDAGSPAEQGTYLHLVLPSIVKRNVDFPIRLRFVTQAGLPDYDFEGGFRLETLGKAEFPAGGLTLEPQSQGDMLGTGVHLQETGVQLLRGSVPDDTVKAMGNPVVVVDEMPEWNVYWGDLNGQTDLSSGALAPAVYWWYAKAVALLDFAAMTDNDAWKDKKLDDATFKDIVGVTQGKEFDEPGRFVPLLGFEWTSPAHGNRLVYFAEPPASLPTFASGVDTPAKLRAAVPAGTVIAIPHPSGAENDPPTDPADASDGMADLVEVYSALGMFERTGTHRPSSRETTGAFVTDLLARDFHPGFLAASDTRLSTPGNPRPVTFEDRRYPGGLTAVLAKELTRGAILDALRAHRCYATTGPRFLLEFKVDGHPMGSALRVPRGHVAEAYGSLGAASKWARVEIVGPEGALGVLTPEPTAADVVELTAKTAPVTGPTWVYLRGTDENGEMAWSSPVYLTVE